jgi:hypothetical protein
VAGGGGIAFWALPGALAQTVDATSLEVLATPRLIADTIANDTTTEVVPGPPGVLALVATTSETGRHCRRGRRLRSSLCDTSRDVSRKGGHALLVRRAREAA